MSATLIDRIIDRNADKSTLLRGPRREDQFIKAKDRASYITIFKQGIELGFED